MSLRDERFGLRLSVRSGTAVGESGFARFTWRDDVRGGVGGRENLFLPEDRILIVATCCDGGV